MDVDDNESNHSEVNDQIEVPAEVEKVIFVSEDYETIDVSNIIPRNKVQLQLLRVC